MAAQLLLCSYYTLLIRYSIDIQSQEWHFPIQYIWHLHRFVYDAAVKKSQVSRPGPPTAQGALGPGQPCPLDKRAMRTAHRTSTRG